MLIALFAILTIFLFISSNLALAEEKISSTPLINLEKIKPSFEELEDISEKSLLDQNLKEKKDHPRLKSLVFYEYVLFSA